MTSSSVDLIQLSKVNVKMVNRNDPKRNEKKKKFLRRTSESPGTMTDSLTCVVRVPEREEDCVCVRVGQEDSLSEVELQSLPSCLGFSF